MNRVGQGLLWAGGFVLAALMVYTLAGDTGPVAGWGHAGAPDGAATVAIFYPERVLWNEFRQAVSACEQKGLLKTVEAGDRAVVVRTRRAKRLVRFELEDVLGVRATREGVARVLALDPGLVAVVGSSNTVLTEAIAESLESARAAGRRTAPVLLIPWASTVLVERPETGEGPMRLLDIDPGRTFRFCPNNQHQADMLADAVTAHDSGQKLVRAVIVEDRHDAYSVDMSASFHRAVERVAHDAEIDERPDSLDRRARPDPAALPGPSEDAFAESVWRESVSLGAGQTLWVLLPLQEEPARRMVLALARHARRPPTKGEGPLRVLCGDAIGYTVLSQLAGRCPFPVWCSGSSSVPAAARAVGEGLSPDTQIPAEIVSAVVRCLDSVPEGAKHPDADTLRDSLASLRVAPGDPAAVGRSLAFNRSGERVGNDLGHVLMIRPDDPTVLARSRLPSGRWDEPVTLRRPATLARP